MEVGQPDSFCGEAVNHWCVKVRSVATKLSESDVVEYDEENIRRIWGRRGFRGPPGFRIPPVVSDSTLEVALHHGYQLLRAQAVIVDQSSDSAKCRTEHIVVPSRP